MSLWLIFCFVCAKNGAMLDVGKTVSPLRKFPRREFNFHALEINFHALEIFFSSKKKILGWS